MSVPNESGAETAREREAFDPVVAVIVWCSLMLYSLSAAPIPAVNEPHYLCKARQYWQPDWCAGDFFLQSTNAHTVFYATVGSLTQWCSLEQSAWIGRLLALLVLAVGWCSLLVTLRGGRWFPLHVCWLFLALQACGNFSGEWLVGGVEGKVFGYGLLFAALGQMNRGRMTLAGGLAGMAVAIHPVIGVWGLLALAGASALDCWPTVASGFFQGTRRSAHPTSLVEVAPPASPRVVAVKWLSGLGVLSLCMLPGLIPVYHLLSESVPQPTKAAANFIQVYYRLAHHLDPMTFLPRAYYGYAALLAVWLVTMPVGRRSVLHRRFDKIVGCAVLFAIVGVIIGWGPRPAPQMTWYAQRAQLLKFYPFRLADVLVPLAVSIGVARCLQFRGLIWKQFIGYGALFAFALIRANAVIETNRYTGELKGDWIAACQWIDQHLPRDVMVYAPHNGWAFKWFAQRAEYVAFKDCPQDAAGIVEWNRRLIYLRRWFEAHYDDEYYSADELREFRHETGITHILTDRLGPLDLDPIFENDSYQVYDLTTLD